MRGVSSKKENPARFGGWMLQTFSECRGWTPIAPGGRGPARPTILLRSTPNLRTSGEPDAWKAWWLLEPRRRAASRGGVGTAGSLPRPRRAEPFPQDQRATCYPRPSHPRILFLLSHGGRRAMPPRGHGLKPQAAQVARCQGRRTRARAAPSQARAPSSVPLTQRPSRPPF